MLTLHHLNNSRSQRILWLLEELQLEYAIKFYQRDALTSLAPATLKLVHPLGKAPVLTDGEVTVAESAAVIEYLIDSYGQHEFKPAAETAAYRQYLYWLHFAEGSLMPPMVAKLVFDKVRTQAKPFFVKAIANKIADKVMDAYFGPNIQANMGFINTHLQHNQWFAGDQLTGADFQMSFPLEASVAKGAAESYPHIVDYISRIHGRSAYKTALQKGGHYDYA